MNLSRIIKNMVPITLFNRGKSSQYFQKAEANGPILVIKNNTPMAIIISPKEYCDLRDLHSVCKKATTSGSLNTYAEKIKALTARIKDLDGDEERND